VCSVHYFKQAKCLHRKHGILGLEKSHLDTLVSLPRNSNYCKALFRLCIKILVKAGFVHSSILLDHSGQVYAYSIIKTAVC